mmetsp:Transcript_74486/g.170840  ORF Transcript_74486/g.170840 Transcript_74486/m.170840 type:complete len:379 (-) Transcript_74486:44-1180(-)
MASWRSSPPYSPTPGVASQPVAPCDLPLEPLEIQVVERPSQDFDDSQRIRYVVQADHLPSKASWRSEEHHYSDFRALHFELVQTFGSDRIPEFPPKIPFLYLMDRPPEQLAGRRAGLTRWVKGLVDDVELRFCPIVQHLLAVDTVPEPAAIRNLKVHRRRKPEQASLRFDAGSGGSRPAGILVYVQELDCPGAAPRPEYCRPRSSDTVHTVIGRLKPAATYVVEVRAVNCMGICGPGTKSVLHPAAARDDGQETVSPSKGSVAPSRPADDRTPPMQATPRAEIVELQRRVTELALENQALRAKEPQSLLRRHTGSPQLSPADIPFPEGKRHTVMSLGSGAIDCFSLADDEPVDAFDLTRSDSSQDEEDFCPSIGVADG